MLCECIGPESTCMQSSSVLLPAGCLADCDVRIRSECLLKHIIAATSPDPNIAMQPTTPSTTVTAIRLVLLQIGSEKRQLIYN